MNEIRRLLPYIRSYLPLVFFAVILLIASGFLEALIIMMLAPIFDKLAPVSSSTAGQGDKFDFIYDWLGLQGDDYFARVALFLVAFSLLKGLFLYLADYSMNWSGQKLVARLREEFYRHLLKQSMTFFSDHPTGKLMARAISDTERLQETVGKRLTDFVRQIFLLLFFLAVVLYADWFLAILSFLIAPVVLTITMQLGRRIRRDSITSQESLADISHALQQTISGQMIVKAFGAEAFEKNRFSKLLEILVKANLKIARVAALGSPLIETIGYIAFVPFLLYFNYQISNEGFTIGAFVVFVAALFRLYEPIRKLSRMHLNFQQTLASAHRIFEILDADIEVVEVEGAQPLEPFRREIRFENVSFRYQSKSDISVLKGINLTIEKGEIIAIVGVSGAGKTTLVSLIPRFYDATEGHIRIDDQDISSVTVTSLRSQIALVTQETFLFDDTIRNNIAYGRADYGEQEVIEAAKAAFMHDFILLELPEGYETRIGERGQRLSGGQKQRIAIARAIMKRAPILILDEATSALDTESEQLVQSALHNLMMNCTTFVIAHRLSTVRLANRIIVLDKGEIVETGSHEELIEESGIYRRLYELQFSPPTDVDPDTLMADGGRY
jgi:subfamily B ATP-binding cassette protein MsbA